MLPKLHKKLFILRPGSIKLPSFIKRSAGIMLGFFLFIIFFKIVLTGVYSQAKYDFNMQLSTAEGKITITSDTKDFETKQKPVFSISAEGRSGLSGVAHQFSDFIRSKIKKTARIENTLIKVEVIDEAKSIVESKEVQFNDLKDKNVLDFANIKTGKYTIRVTDLATNTSTEQNFSWGVLAINTDQSVYQPGDTAQIYMAVLDNEGNMDCDASLQLIIKTPDKSEAVLTSENAKILVGSDCKKKSFSLVPDFSAEYQTDKPGTYQMELTAHTGKGSYTIRDSFTVSADVPFTIQRIAQTRIYPFAKYPVIIAVTPKNDFSGIIEEEIPSSFSADYLDNASLKKNYGIESYDIENGVERLGNLESRTKNQVSNNQTNLDNQNSNDQESDNITKNSQMSTGHSERSEEPKLNTDPSSGNTPSQEDNSADRKTLSWNVNWKAGETHFIAYEFDAPDKSPEFYLLGPLKINSQSTIYNSQAGTGHSERSEESQLNTDPSSGNTPPQEDNTIDNSENKNLSLVYSEPRSWQIASDASGDVLLFWDTTTYGTFPTQSAWVTVTTYDGKFIQGNVTPGASGGNATHTHTVTTAVPTVNTPSAKKGTGGTSASALGHTHTLDITGLTASNDPANRTLTIIKSVGAPSTVPSNAIAMFDAAVNANYSASWTQYTAENGYYIKGGATSITGGWANDTHVHTLTLSLGAAGGTNPKIGNNATPSVAVAGHTHSFASTVTSAAVTYQPKYRDVMLFRNSSGTAAQMPPGMIAMFDATAPTGWTRDSDFDGALLRANSTFGVAIAGGGAHGATTNITGLSSQTASSYAAYGNGSGTDMVGYHSHTGISITSWSTPDEAAMTPQYNGLVIAKYTPPTMTISGAVKDTDESATLSALTASNSLKIVVAGGLTYTTNISSGTYTLGSIIIPADNTAVLLYISGQATKGSAVTVVPNTGAQTYTVNIFKDRMAVRSDRSATSITNQLLANVDTGDTDDLYSMNTLALSVASNIELHVSDGKTYDPGGTVTTQGTGDFHIAGTGGTAYLDTDSNTIAGDIKVEENSTLNIDGNTAVNGGDITTSGTSAVVSYTGSTNKTVTISGTGSIGGGTTPVINFYNLSTTGAGTTTISSPISILHDLSVGSGTTLQNNAMVTVTNDVSVIGKLIIAADLTINGGDLTNGTGIGGVSITYLNTPTTTISGTGNLGVGSGSKTLYNLTTNGSSQTTTLVNPLVVDNSLSVGSGHTFSLGNNTLIVGSNSISNSGGISNSGTITQINNPSIGAVTIKSAGGSATIGGTGTTTFNILRFMPGAGSSNPTFILGSASGQTITINQTLTIGDGTYPVTVTASSNNPSIDIGGDFSIATAAGANAFTAPPSSSFTIAGNFTNPTSTYFNANNGTVTMDATSGTPTITSGGASFNNLNIDNGGTSISWELQDALDVNGYLRIDTINTLDAKNLVNNNVNVAKDLTVNGTYQARGNTTTLDGADGTTQAVSGNITFSALHATASATRTITFGASSTITVADITLTGGGSSTNCNGLLLIRSATPGTYFTITNNDALPTVSYVDFQDTHVGTNAFSGTGIVDSGGNNNITADNSCIGASSSSAATGYSFQRKTFKDATSSANVHWLLYYDGNGINYKYSTDNGTTWVRAGSLSYNTNDFSLWNEVIGGKEYVWLAVTDSANYDVLLLRGEATNTGTPNISWSSAVTALAGDASNNSYDYPYVAVDQDSTKKAWVTARHHTGSNYVIVAVKTATAANVTDFTTTTFGTASVLSYDTSTSTNVYGSITPLATGDMYAAFVVNTTLSGCRYILSSEAWKSNNGADSCTSSETPLYFKSTSADDQTDAATAANKAMTGTLGSSTQNYTLDGTNTSFYVLTDNANKKWTSDRSMTTDTTGEKRNIDMAVDSSGNQVAVWEDTRNSDSTGGVWNNTGSFTDLRSDHTATLMNNGKVLVAGGNGSSTVTIYDPTSGSWSDTGSLDVGHNDHTATLLNNGKVLVAGGVSGGSTYLSSASLYDPNTGTWQNTTNNLSTARSFHTATLLNNGKVLVAGGRDTGNLGQSTASLYDPATGTWSDTGSFNGIRQRHTATLLNNGKVLVAGGYDTSNYYSDAYLYDPVAGKWLQTGSFETGRYGHTATLLNNGKVLIAGGYQSAGTTYISTGSLYDPATETWVTTGSFSNGRLSHTATLLNNGKVLIAGGCNDTSCATAFSTALLYDPASGNWSDTNPFVTTRGLHTATLLNNGKVLIAGGQVGTSTYTSSSELYTPKTSDIYTQKYDKDGTALWNSGVDIKVNSDDGNRDTAGNHAANYDHLNPKVKLDSSGNAIITWQEARNSVYGDDIYAQKLSSATGGKLWPASTTGTWTNTGSFQTSRKAQIATLLNNGKVLIAGGNNGNSLSSASLYDPATGTWTDTGSFAGGRQYFTATLLNNGKVLIAGGNSGVYESSASLYDPVTGIWTNTGSFSVSRQDHTATLLPNGKVLIAGGYRINETLQLEYLSSASLYDPSTGSWTNTGSFETGRSGHTATLLNNGKVLITGGYWYDPGNHYESTASLYDPATGTWTNTGSFQTGRYEHTATLLNNGKVLLAGGYSGDYESTASLYDPSTGTWTNTGSFATGREYHTATLLNNGKVLIAGGQSGASVYESSAALYTTSTDIQVSNDGSAANGTGLPNPEYPNHIGIVSEQRNPTIGIDSSNDIVVAWEDTRNASMRNWGLSYDIGNPATTDSENAWWQRNVNQGANGTCNGGGGTNNSCGAISALQESPVRIMGQKLLSSSASKAWGTNLDLYNKNNPEDIGLSATGDTNAHPKLDMDGTTAVLVWDSNSVIANDGTTPKRESNIYTQKFDTNGNSLLGGNWNNTGNFETGRSNHTATLLNNGKILVAGGYWNDGSSHYESSATLYDPSTGTWTNTGSFETGRYMYTATLLNNGLVLIAGGQSGTSAYESSATLYDPSTGTWTNTGSFETGRSNHTATLLSNGKVLIAGGFSIGYVSSATLYDPSTGTWTNTGSFETRRSSHTATLLNNGKVLIAGGESSSYLSSATLYDPATGTWTNTGSFATGRSKHTATLLNNGKVLITGGVGSLSSATLYDPSTGAWTNTGSLETGRTNHTATLLNNGKVLIARGVGSLSAVSSATLYDPSTGAWTNTGSLETGNSYHTATLLNNGKILVAGGYWNDGSAHYGSSATLYSPDLMVNTGSDLSDQTNPDVKVSGSNLFYTWQGVHGSSAGGTTSSGGDRGGLSYDIFGQKYDNPSSGSLTAAWPNGSTGVWSNTGSMDTARYSHTATLLNNGKVLVAGGYGGGSNYLSTSSLYDPAAGTWTATGSFENGRYGQVATSLNNGKVLIAGGYDNSTFYSSAALYDPSTGTWTNTGVFQSGRNLHAAVLLNNGKVLLAGGQSANNAPGCDSSGNCSSASIYDPSTGTWTNTGNFMTPRYGLSLTLLNNGKVLLAGGSSGATNYSSSTIYDPSTGTWTNSGDFPTGRYSHSATLLNNGKVLIAGGKSDTTTYESTAALYDPNSGTWTATSGLFDTGRYDHTATLLNNGKVLIVGGNNGFISLSSLYDPSTDRWTNTGTFENGRYNHTALLLPNGKVLIAGGNSSGVSSSTALYNPAGEMLMSHDFAISGDQTDPKLLIDSGNPVVVWQDNRPKTGNFVDANITYDSDIYMQKFDGTTGEPLWPATATTGGYSSPYTTMDIRVDTVRGAGGTHYSGRPAAGITGTLGDGTKRIVVAYEDNRNTASSSAGECGYSNSSAYVRVCAQSYDMNEQHATTNRDWTVYFKMGTPTSASITVETAVAESAGFQLAKIVPASSAWTACTTDCSEMQTRTFTTGNPTTGPPTDTVQNISFRRLMVRFTRTAGSVTMSYDNIGADSKLAIAAAGVQDTIDNLVPTGLNKTLSLLTDNVITNAHIIYIDDESTDQLSYKRYNATSSAWDSTPVKVSGTGYETYPSLTVDTGGGADLYAFWVNSNNGYVEYRKCNVSADTSECSTETNWDYDSGSPKVTDWQTYSGTKAYISSDYGENNEVFAMWQVGGTQNSIAWNRIGISAVLSLYQNDFRWMTPDASTDLGDNWPPNLLQNVSADLAENQVLTQLPATNMPLVPDSSVVDGNNIRLRMNITADGDTLSAGTQAFTLQYKAAESCTDGTSWTDVGGTGSTTAWKLYNNEDIGSSLLIDTTSLSTTDVAELYSEDNPNANNPEQIIDGNNGEYDWPIQNYSAQDNTAYCFRMVKSNGTPINYNSDSYPQIYTDPGMTPLMRHGKFFQNETLKGEYWAN